LRSHCVGELSSVEVLVNRNKGIGCIVTGSLITGRELLRRGRM
jgi:hypothetical protein